MDVLNYVETSVLIDYLKKANGDDTLAISQYMADQKKVTPVLKSNKIRTFTKALFGKYSK